MYKIELEGLVQPVIIISIAEPWPAYETRWTKKVPHNKAGQALTLHRSYKVYWFWWHILWTRGIKAKHISNTDHTCATSNSRKKYTQSIDSRGSVMLKSDFEKDDTQQPKAWENIVLWMHVCCPEKIRVLLTCRF